MDMRAYISLVERKRRRRERMKLLTGNMTTYGYAFAGSALIDPLLRTEGLRPVNFILIGAALVLHVIASDIAPEGEAS